MMANFNSIPTIHAPRSRFDLSFSNKTSGNVGTLYPMYIQEIYPGDSFDCNCTVVSRLTSAYFRPVMDDLYMDIYFFFVPYRICYKKWSQIFGDNRASAWAQATPVSAPVMKSDSVTGVYIGCSEKTVGDYLGLPLATVVDGEFLPDGISVLPFRAFAKIYDDWFRDENIIAPMSIEDGDWLGALGTEIPNNNAWASNNYFGYCPKVAKFHDYFTSALPSSQKGSPIQIPVTGLAPLTAKGIDYTIPVKENGHVNLAPHGISSGSSVYFGSAGSTAGGDLGALMYRTESTSGWNNGSFDTNLYADVGSISATVNDLRLAFQLQKILERSARSGTRLNEYILAAFNVVVPDARLQRPEYLGGKRFPLSVQQVAQTSRTDSEPNALGSLGAFSLSNGKAGYHKAFVEHGVVIGVFCLRQRHDYPQGLEKFWTRSTRFSFYDPTLANLGEQPIYKSELFAKQSVAGIPFDAQAFGYQEAWADLRYRPNKITAGMRSDSTDKLDMWHFGDDYSNAPTLNKQWIEETPDNVDRCIAVDSSKMDQFIFDFYFKQYGTRRLPSYSVPSLIDHN